MAKVMSNRLTPADERLLAHVVADDVTYRLIGSGRRGYSYRLWLDENRYELVTARMKGLMAKRLVKHDWGWQYGSGLMSLTDAGRAHIGSSEPYQSDRDHGHIEISRLTCPLRF